jgi:hypothetical protein
MDWLNTQFYRDFGYGLIYPQLFPHHKRRSEEAHSSAIAWGQQGAKNWLQILNDHWIGPKNQYLCGNELTIADYIGAAVVSIGELVGCDFSAYPNIKRWLDNLKRLKSWDRSTRFSMALSPPIRGRTSYACEPADVSLLASTPYSITSSAQRQIVKTKCPLWVKSGHAALKLRCTLFPQKRTLPADS